MTRFSARANPFWLAGGFWLVFVIAASIAAWKSGGIALDTDDAMRLAELRDLLSGQSWFDTAQWRMDVPLGLPMHWSRLIDAPLAVLVLVARPFVGPQAAETAALWFWPFLPFLATLAALARLANILGGRASALIVLFLAVTAVEILGLFTPGAIDHHNVQIALTLWMLTFLVEEKLRAVALTAALSLAVGLETLPYVVAAILVAAFSWIRSGEARLARRFGFTLATSALVLLFGAAAARYRFAGACDTYSFFYAAPLAAGGLGLALLGALRLDLKKRAFALAGLAVLVVGLAVLINPLCLEGPYAGMNPRLGAVFLSRINEARSVFSFARFAPSEFVTGYVYAVAGLLASFAVLRSDLRGWIVILFATAALGAASIQIREVPFAIVFGLPGLGVFVRRFAAARGLSLAAILLLLVSDVSFALTGAAFEGRAQAARIAAFEAQTACGSPAALAPLARLPKGRVAGFVDQGPAVLAYTYDGAVAGPYHRDADGILDTYAIFTGAPSKAQAILKRRGIDYLMICAAAPDWDFYRKAAPDGLLARLAQGHTPAWLVPAGHDESNQVQVYRIKF